MATVTEPSRQTAPRDDRVYHPLDRLRGIIRRYVVIEGLLSVLIFLGAWFALALTLDYGIFKAFTWDWVQDGTWWLRLAALVAALALLAGILVFRIIRRLSTEFSYPALALVLERRYPAILGDRLITAVELADVDQAARLGFSADMIRQTISEARERVGQVNVHEVFNWRRLRIMGLLAVGIPVVILAAALAAHSISSRDFKPAHAAWKFFHVSSIVAERDLALMNTPWPRRALLELHGDARDGLRVARDGAAPRVKVKAYQWVVADRGHPDGWRPLMWSEVNDSLVGTSVPAVPFRSLGYANEPTLRSHGLGSALGAVAMVSAPDENPEFSASAEDWTVDAIYERAREGALQSTSEKEATEPPQIARLKNKMGEAAFRQLQDVFAKLDALAADPAMGRRLRKLDKPEAVSFSYSGLRTAGSGTFNPEGDGVYAGEISGLKEDVRFVVKAEDYRTQPKPITLIAPPTLTKLAHVSYQPAYLHYAAPQGEGYAALRGLRQLMREENLSLTGDKSILEVPSGTEVILTGTTEQPIANAWVIPKVGLIPGAKPGSAAPVALRITDRSREHGVRPLRWSEVTAALVGVPVPELPHPRAWVVGNRAAARTDPADLAADDVVAWVRTSADSRQALRAQLGESAFDSLALALQSAAPAAAAAVRHAAPVRSLERAFAVLDEKFRDEAGKYILPLGTTFTLEFTGDYRFVKRAQPYEFDFVYQNLDRVESTRQILIHVKEDQQPVVELAADVIRRVGNVYYVTPRAKIPFVAESYIKDDNGLSKVEYTYTLNVEDSDLSRAMRVANLTRAVIPPVGGRFPEVVQGLYHTGTIASLDRGDTRTSGSFVHGGFRARENELRRETLEHLHRLLASPLAGESVKLVGRYNLEWKMYDDKVTRPNGSLESFKWKMAGDYFDIAALKLEVPAGEIQPRYRIDLNVQATDTNFDTGPRTAANIDPVRLLVVSSGDLLAEIGKEEEALGIKLDEAIAKLTLARANYAFVSSKHITRLPDEIDPVKVKSKGVIQDIAKAREIVLNVGRAYRKIEKEAVVNDFDDRNIAQYGRLANRIDRVLGETPMVVSPDEDAEIRQNPSLPFGILTPDATFPATEQALTNVQNILEEGRYADQVQAAEAESLVTRLEREVGKIRALISEAQSKEKLRQAIEAIINRQREVQAAIKLWRDNFARTLEEPALGAVGEIFLAKGESKQIKQTVSWRLYKGPPGSEDTLVVKLAASDPSIVVPAELKLDYEKNNNDFTYEVRAGTKEGTYTVTVTPAAGDKVEFKVIVK